MKNHFNYFLLFLIAATSSFSGCSAIADIFKAGVWVGILLVVVVVIIIIVIASKLSKK